MGIELPRISYPKRSGGFVIKPKMICSALLPTLALMGSGTAHPNGDKYSLVFMLEGHSSNISSIQHVGTAVDSIDKLPQGSERGNYIFRYITKDHRYIERLCTIPAFTGMSESTEVSDKFLLAVPVYTTDPGVGFEILDLDRKVLVSRVLGGQSKLHAVRVQTGLLSESTNTLVNGHPARKYPVKNGILVKFDAKIPDAAVFLKKSIDKSWTLVRFAIQSDSIFLDQADLDAAGAKSGQTIRINFVVFDGFNQSSEQYIYASGVLQKAQSSPSLSQISQESN